MSLFIPITKVDVAKHLVYGTLTEEVPDKSGEILDYATAKPAFMEWSNQFQAASGGKSLGNVRAMHGSVAAGKFTDLSYDDENKRIDGVAKIIDDDEWQKVLEGVYTGFSIGGGYARRWPDPDNPELMRYTPTLSEVSLVDNPAVPTATFEVIKHDGSVELRKFNFNEEDSSMTTNQPAAAEQDDECTEETLLEHLAWLEEQLSAGEDIDILAHIHALQDYIENNEDASEEDSDEEEDASSEAYATELAHFNAHREMRKRNDANLRKQINQLHKRVVQLESHPLPAKATLRVISKADDRYNDAYISRENALAKLSPDARARELMKIALSNPVEI